ncbi:MAG: hypothetical protein JWN86_1412 [Planctomycetota bacterium]|nr:hypothetical protein [Planctomycetota bacterium]
MRWNIDLRNMDQGALVGFIRQLGDELTSTLEDHERRLATECPGEDGEGRHEWLKVEAEYLDQRLDDLFDEALTECGLRDRGGEEREPILRLFGSGPGEPLVKCLWCGGVATREQAIELGWVPSFFVGEEGVDRPACCECADRHLDHAPDGEFVLREGHSLPPTMSERRPMTEGEVEQAIRLFAGRQLCDRCDLEPADAMTYIHDHELGIVEAL